MAKIDREHLLDMWDFMPPGIQKALRTAVETLGADEKIPRGGLTKQCPRCGAKDTTDCHDIAGISDATVGLCITCGYLWCLECETYLISTITCGHWKICANCGERKDESGYCRTVPWECTYIRSWIRKSSATA